MSGTDLCQLPPQPSDGCCDASPPPPAAPLPIDNPPGLATIGYRIGTFTSFRRAMFNHVAGAGAIETSPPSGGPFANWREGADGDYQTVFIELWSYLADILTFYQERIANEAFIGTASQGNSARLLTQLIGYLPKPGSGASGLVAFNVAKGKVVAVPQGFRIASRAQGGRAAASFETSSPLTARAEHNAIPLSAVAPTNQFARLSSFRQVFAAPGPLTLDQARELYHGAGGTFLKSLVAIRTTTALSSGRSSNATTRAPAIPTGFAAFTREFRPQIIYRPFINVSTRTVVLAGTNTRLAAGDYLLTVENEHDSNEKASLYQLSSVSSDKDTNTTTIAWQEPAGTTYAQPVTVCAMRVRAAPFASTAPNWNTLSPTLTTAGSPPLTAQPPYPDNWDDPNKSAHYIVASSAVALDGTYDAARATPDNPNWMAFVSGTDGGPRAEIHRVINTRPVVHTEYAGNGRVTELVISGGTAAPQQQFGIRDTLILIGAEELTLQNELPLPDPVQGDTLILDGLYPNLQAGQVTIITGNLFDSSGPGLPGEPISEVCRLLGPPLPDTDNALTTVELQNALQNHYVRSTTALLANVVDVTQGESVADEVLGSSDGSALQSYRLKKRPLTYLPSVDPQTGSAVQSALAVVVNGVRWQEKPTLFESRPDGQHFTVTRDDTGISTIAFGDGVNGARPPTGANNIHARYRFGLGGAGNVPAIGVQQLVTSLAGLQQVTNPQPTSGGAEPEALADIRDNAPDSVRAFNRAVSTSDYATLARSFPGIAKANAQRIQFDANGKALAAPYVQLTAAGTDGTPISGRELIRQLRTFLDQRRDPNVPLRILDFTPVFVDFAVTINLDDRVPRQATFSRIRAALNSIRNPDGTAGYFAFDNLDFGESLHLSAIYAFIQNIPGVRDTTVTRFRRVDLGDATLVQNDILIGPTEIAVIGSDADTQQRLLAITQGAGGFIDT
jgi:uncharacterized phage protein gp47/JayE